VNDPNIIELLSKKYGSSTILVAIETIHYNGNYLVYTENGREQSNYSLYDWAKMVEDKMAGEILLTLVDTEGTGKGFEIDVIKKVCESVSIPVIIHGGCGKVEHILEVARSTDISGVVISSMFHYNYYQSISIDYTTDHDGNTDYIRAGSKPKNIHPASIRELKQYLLKHNIACRL